LAILSLIGILNIGLKWTDFTIFAALSGTGLYGFFKLMEDRRIRQIDTIFPDFVRDLAESRRAGMTFTKALLFSAKGNYGILTQEINKIAQQVSWGTSVNDALLAFSDRVPTSLIRRTVSLIIEASKSGGNVADVLDAASRDAREIKMLEAERRANMASYVVVIYVGMMVFLVIIAVLSSQFLPAMIMQEGAGSQMGATQAHVDAITAVFFWAGILQGFGSGMVAGVFEDGKFVSGIKHIFIMVLITWFVFKLLIGVQRKECVKKYEKIWARYFYFI
jgi:flagellar protein FlaJ